MLVIMVSGLSRRALSLRSFFSFSWSAARRCGSPPPAPVVGLPPVRAFIKLRIFHVVVGRGVEDVVIPEPAGDSLVAETLASILKDGLYHLRRLRVDDIAEGGFRTDKLSGLRHDLFRGAGLFAGLFGVVPVKKVDHGHHVGVWVFVVPDVVTVRDGDEAHAQARKDFLHVFAGTDVVASEPREILDDDGVDAPALGVLQEVRERRTLEIRAGVSVVNVLSTTTKPLWSAKSVRIFH